MKRDNGNCGRGGLIKRLFSALLAFVFAAALLPLAGCREKPGPSGPVDITDDVEAYMTAAPATETPEPTQEPTLEPTEEPTPEPTAAPTENAGKRKVYLTIDDGPNSATPEVLDILKEYGIKATFFTIGHCIKAYPATAKRIVEEGHLLACHTDSHNFDIIYSGPEAFVQDVAKWRQTVINAIGYDAGAYVYRFPGGSTNSSVGGRKGRTAYVEAMNREGYIAMDWNLGLNDKWLAGNTDHLPIEDYLWLSYTQTYAMFKNTDPLILIIHDTEPATLRVLPKVLDDLISKGFEFGLCDELSSDYLM
ncbi:MAG: polysaccharide deacetylase family protein [Clostridia bacterium]|nr:polysaccharide deacetylase family protein [Clostridia bacterium]